MTNTTKPTAPSVFGRIGRAWGRISPSLVPIFAVITALIFAVPFIILTRSGGDIGRGLNVAGLAYSGLIEGSVGIAINPAMTPNDVSMALDFIKRLEVADGQPLAFNVLRQISERTSATARIGIDTVRRYGTVLEKYAAVPELSTDEALETFGNIIPEITRVGDDRLCEFGSFFLALREVGTRERNEFIARYATLDAVDSDIRADIEAFVPTITEVSEGQLASGCVTIPESGASVATLYTNEELTDVLVLLNSRPFNRVFRAFEHLVLMKQLDMTSIDQDAQDLADMHRLSFDPQNPNGIARTRQLVANNARLVSVAVADGDIPQLAGQLLLVANLYSSGLLTNTTIIPALENDLPAVLDEKLVILRPNNQLLILSDAKATFGMRTVERQLVGGEIRTVPDVVYAHIGNSAILFFPASVEQTIMRAIPYIIAGLAVALGFKTGLFNIGAQGQMYIGTTLATWVGFSSLFAGLPAFLYIPLVLMAGMLGGALWGMIPGLLKAYTGAHEVINTIMLNFIALRLVDWLVRSTDPVMMRDLESGSFERSLVISPNAQLPNFDYISLQVFLFAGIITAVWGLLGLRKSLGKNPMLALRPILYGVMVFLGGLALQWLSVGGKLHVGIVVVIFAVIFVTWLFNRTTIGFELRTVGANPDAARYAGMNVKWNIVLAMILSGMLAGLAGTVYMSGVDRYMQPVFLPNLGFDAIAVALLARNNPRNMIFSGLLWGGLLTGSSLMQANAGLSSNLVGIIQALIIMFIAADAIIRTLWRVRKATPEERAAAIISKGWGG
ncbi:MAG: ABC transporter permease [Anaerolineae bacterium]|jgi:simple sugar transport system permease protein|nr:ABC transporter permease [Anaerolineae bacterium]